MTTPDAMTGGSAEPQRDKIEALKNEISKAAGNPDNLDEVMAEIEKNLVERAAYGAELDAVGPFDPQLVELMNRFRYQR